MFMMKNARADHQLLGIFDHPLYGPDLAASNFHLVPKLKDFLDGSYYGSIEKLKESINE